MPQRTGSGFRGVLDTPRSLPVEGGEECTNAKDRPLSNHGTFNRKRSSPLPAARPPPLETSPTSPNSSTSETPTRSIPNEQNGRRDSDMYRYHYDEPTLEFSKVCQDPQKPYKSVLERYEISPSSGAAAPEYPQEGGGLNFAHARINTTNGSIGCNNTSIKTCINIKNYHQASAELDQGRIEAFFEDLNLHVDRAAFSRPFEEDGCATGTRTKLLENILSWINCDGPLSFEDQHDRPFDGRHLCIVGVPGSGKSAILITIAETLARPKQRDSGEEVIYASYFIQRDEASTTDLKHIFPTLAAQLCAYYPTEDLNLLLQIIRESVANMENPRRPQIIDVARDALLWPIELISQFRPTRKIVLLLDAVDEADNPFRLAETLRALIPCLPPNIRLILTTRPEQDVLNTVLRRTCIELHTRDSCDVVHHYMEQRLREGIRSMPDLHPRVIWADWPSTSQIQLLAERASGLFLWARTAVDLILSSVKVHGRTKRDSVITAIQASGFTFTSLNSIIDDIGRAGRKPADLHSLYSVVFENALAGSDREQTLRYVRRFLGLLTFLRQKHKWSMILAFLGIHWDSEMDLQHYIRKTRSILAPTVTFKTNRIAHVHASVFDFLVSADAGEHQLQPPACHWEIFVRSIELMTAKLHFNVSQLKSSFLHNRYKSVHLPTTHNGRNAQIPAHLTYACESWGYHLDKSTEALMCTAGDNTRIMDIVKPFLEHYLLYWLEVLSVRQTLDLAVTSLETLKRSVSSKPGTSSEYRDFELLLTEAISFVTEAQEPMSTSAPHIYLSAPLWFQLQPGRVPLFDLLKRQAPLTLVRHAGVATYANMKQADMKLLKGKRHFLQVSANGELLAIMVGHKRQPICIIFVYAFDAHHPTLVGFATIDYHQDRSDYPAFCLLPDKIRVASLVNGDVIQIIDLNLCAVSGQLERTLVQNLEMFSPLPTELYLELASNGAKLFAWSLMKSVRVWDLIEGRQAPTITTGSTQHNTKCVAQNMDGTTFLTCSERYTIGGCIEDLELNRWDYATCSVLGPSVPLETSEWTRKDPRYSFSGDHSMLLGVDEDIACVWNTQTGGVAATHRFSGEITVACISHLGSKFACVTEEGVIYVCRLDSSTLHPPSQATGRAFYGERVQHLSFSPDATLLVSASSFEGSDAPKITVRIWDIENAPSVTYTAEANARPLEDSRQITDPPTPSRVVLTKKERNGTAAFEKREKNRKRKLEPLTPVAPAGFMKSVRDCTLNDGWVKGPQDQLLFWVPKTYRGSMWRENNTAVFHLGSGQDSTFQVVIPEQTWTGEEWLDARLADQEAQV